MNGINRFSSCPKVSGVWGTARWCPHRLWWLLECNRPTAAACVCLREPSGCRLAGRHCKWQRKGLRFRWKPVRSSGTKSWWDSQKIQSREGMKIFLNSSILTFTDESPRGHVLSSSHSVVGESNSGCKGGRSCQEDTFRGIEVADERNQVWLKKSEKSHNDVVGGGFSADASKD